MIGIYKCISTLTVVAATLVNASAIPKSRRQTPDNADAWSNAACDAIFAASFSTFNLLVPPNVECGWLTVPLDYANDRAGTTDIALIRAPARTRVRKGTIIMNPGGPGGNGIANIGADGGASLQALVGDDWDIVSFAPRGVAPSGPVLTYFPDARTEVEFWRPISTPGGFLSHGNLTTQPDIDLLMSQAPAMDAKLVALNDMFVKQNGDNLKYIGTAAVARDIALLTDVLEGPGSDINYWGFSYGTLLGMVLIQLFPDRVGKVILDGVVDPRDWAEYSPHLGWDLWVSDTEEAYKGFTRACAGGGPRACALALSTRDTAEDIDTRIRSGLDDIHRRFRTSQDDSWVDAAGFLHFILRNPGSWSELSAQLASILTGSFGTSLKSRRFFSPLPVEPLAYIPVPEPYRDNGKGGNEGGSVKSVESNSLLGGDYAIFAISCGDSADSDATTEQVFKQMVRASQTSSSLFGSMLGQRYFCHRWSSRAVERYKGPWNAKPKNVVLVINTEADPITPYRNAKLIASNEMLGSSARLVQQWDFGHVSLSAPSACTANVIADYMSGLPPVDRGNDDEDVVCPVDISVMGNPIGTHFDPISSENGDGLTSGPSDPGFIEEQKENQNGGNNKSPATSTYATLQHATPLRLLLGFSALLALL